MKFNPCPKPEKEVKSKYDLRKATQLKAKNKRLVAKIKTPKQSISKLKKVLDKVFNEFIRLRDKGKPCISCNQFKTLQAGHYHSCRYMAVRWDERNVNGQCVGCNVFNQGNAHGYREGMIKKYGENTVHLLTLKKLNRCKLTAFELTALINEYESKVKYLKAIK